MNEPQLTMLFALFSPLSKARGWNNAERTAARNRITTDLFGRPRSWATLTNPEVDRLKARLRAIAQTEDLTAQMEDATAGGDGERRRLIHRIESDKAAAGFDWAYVKGLARDLYDRSDWRELPLPQLKNLRDLVANRARRKALPRRPLVAAPVPQPELPVNHFS